MSTFKALVVEVERDGDWDNFQWVTVEANNLQEVFEKVQKPRSFVNKTWAVRKIELNGREIFNGFKMFRF